jgi:putative membrane protein
MLTQSLAGLPAFLSYFATGIGLLAVFLLLLYLWITPYREISLIREGNAAAAASLSGAMVGFMLPLASAITHSVSLLDMAIWGLIALIIQLLVYGVGRLLLPSLARDIPAGQVASGVFLGALSLAIGLLNAACMTY